MNNLSKLLMATTVSILTHFTSSAYSQELGSLPPDLEDWGALDENIRQTIIQVMSARRGLDPNLQTAGTLIRSAEDIAEAATISCEISGSCIDLAGRATMSENHTTFPPYDLEQGLRNAERIMRIKSGDEN